MRSGKGVHSPVDQLGFDSDRPYAAKVNNRAVFVGLGFFLLSGGKDYRIAHNYEIVDWDRLTDSLSSCVRAIETGCLLW